MGQNISEEICIKAEEMLRSGSSGMDIVAGLTDVIDNMLFASYHIVTKDLPSIPLTLMAVGGYGRRELAPYSDVDIMLLAKKRDPLVSETAETVLYGLWDLGLNISHAFRTLDECVEDAMSDIKTRTSLIESRFLAGSREVFDEYKRDVFQKLLYKGKKDFIAEKLREIKTRHRTYGESIYLLEPNVKEGRGGLRDIHSALWLARVVSRINDIEGLGKILTEREHRHLIKSYDYFLRARLCLHVSSKRKNDILSFESQDAVAEMIGLKSTSRFLAAEILMRLYYKKAKNVTDALARVADLAGRQNVGLSFGFSLTKINDDFYISKNEIAVRDRAIFRDSDRIMEAFHIFSVTGKKLSFQVKDTIRSRFVFINKKARSSKKAINYFLKILGGNRVYETLREMHETGILDRFLPEFGRLRNLVKYEPYHRYTVDEHTLTAVKNLEMLKTTRHANLLYLRDILKTVGQEVIFMAVLLHDIGKGAAAVRGAGLKSRHEEAGYKLLKAVLERFNISSDDRQRIEFLVKNHIVLSRLVLTRDADAPETITQLAEVVENEKNLDSLYLITYADVSAVNPDFWTEWKAYLFHDIYIRTRDYLRGFSETYSRALNSEIKELVEDMPYRYLISNQISEMELDFKMVVEARAKQLCVSIFEQADGTAEFTIVTQDMPGLFSRIVGAMGSCGLNILRARLYTGKSGTVVDKITVSNWKDIWWNGLEVQISKDLEDSIKQGTDERGPKSKEHTRKAGHCRQAGKLPHVFSRFESFVEVDNETSPDYTILELFSTDRLGLLYDISTQLHVYNTDIISAIINTEDRLAQDVFYIQYQGKKLDAETALNVMNSVYNVIA